MILSRAMRSWATVAILGVGAMLATERPASGAGSFRILVFSKTAGFRHSSIPNGIAAIQQLGAQNNFEVVATEDSSVFDDTSLAQFRAVVFLLTTGDVLNAGQQAAFERYIQAGNGYVGVHSASDTEYSWPWYGGLVGAYFSSHPAIQTATIHVEDLNHPSTSPLPAEWVRNDEWYNFRTNPRSNVNVLAVLDEKTYSGGTMGNDHPIAWYHEYDGGRAWYTAGGHTSASYSELLFLRHLLGGIQYAAEGPDGPAARTVALVQPGEVWKYLDTGANEGAAWQLRDYDDAAWRTGAAQLGYGDDDEVTLIRSNRGTDGTRIITTYFRKQFVVSNAWALANLTLGLLRDDGGIVYLNESEVFRSNIANGPVDYTTRAATAVGGADEDTFFSTNVSAALLIEGTNLLAVEIHQSSTTSSDVSFDLYLGGLEYPRPELSLMRSGAELRLSWPVLPPGFSLEWASSVGPGGAWSAVTQNPVVSNGENTVVVQLNAGTRLYRLVHGR